MRALEDGRCVPPGLVSADDTSRPAGGRPGGWRPRLFVRC